MYKQLCDLDILSLVIKNLINSTTETIYFVTAQRMVKIYLKSLNFYTPQF